MFVVLVLCGLGLPLPEDVALIIGGYLAYLGPDHNGVSSLAVMMMTGLAGILVGDSIIFRAGRRYGNRLSDSAWFGRIVTPEKLERSRAFFELHGEKVVIVTRFIPGVRAVSYFTAGASAMPYWRFLLFDAVAACVSAPLWVLTGHYFGGHVEVAFQYARRVQGSILCVAVVTAAIFALYRWRAMRAAMAPTQPEKTSKAPNRLMLAAALLGAAYVTHHLLVRRPGALGRTPPVAHPRVP